MPGYKKCKFHLSRASFPLPGALFRPPSLHQTYETCIFVPQKIGTYIRWLPWWLLFIRILPLRVPSQHWWYPNPVPRFGFLASWSQIPTQVLLYLGFILNSLDITVSISVEKYQKLQLAAQRILDSKSPTIKEVAQLIDMMVSCFPCVNYGELYYRREIEKNCGSEN